MLKSNNKFHAENGKRVVLVVDDEFINRELLKGILGNDYDVLLAENGSEALEIINENKEILSIILLDLMMPAITGKELLKKLKDDESTSHIPVIVMTADYDSEVECLELGAIDFIPKPYPSNPVILARVRRTIELSEDRQIIQVTERDSLTGLYNREFFFRYCVQYDKHHPEAKMDSLLININHFRMVNERYGKTYGDEILTKVAEKLRIWINEHGGIVCRRDGDTFLAYCPHQNSYEDLIDSVVVNLGDSKEEENKVRLRMGVYTSDDLNVDIERRFDRAKMASDTIRNSYNKAIAYYDNKMHEKEMFDEKLIEAFPKAIREEQFVVYYQPKFYIQGEKPSLASAEALVRWNHPELGIIAPGLFIPLFENNGLIQNLDRYVWEKVAVQIKEWKQQYGKAIPVSVNVSRVDMFEPGLLETFERLLKENGLTTKEFLLEITESAYTEDSKQIIAKVSQLRQLGFQIEMDDFGTGYSSLNMISSLPIDALKIDMKFIHDAFQEKIDTRLIEVIIDIAEYLNVEVIAEGVETEAQLESLKKMGCDIVQGYYFSKPVPSEEFENFIKA